MQTSATPFLPQRRFSPTLAGLLGKFLQSPWSLLLAVALAFFLGSNTLPLTDVDEGAFSEATREMLARGNLVSPTLNEQPRHDKPILIYWTQAASVSLLGTSEFAFRLPSLIASLLWLWALYRFCLRHCGRQQAQLSCLVMVLSLQVGLIAKAAIADALLNLFIARALLWIYDFFCLSRQATSPARIRRLLLAIYAALGLGFLTKGPVAVFLPLLVSGLFFVSAGAWRDWLRAAFDWRGWLLFLAIVVPWHILVYLDQGDAFFRGFYLQHNLNRYASTFEGHGGNPFFYLAILPLILLPFSGWLLAIAGALWRKLKTGGASCSLERYLLIWFGVVFIFFSFSRTQLPHYLLYGCTPLFILLGHHRPAEGRRWLAMAPAILAAIFLVALPLVLDFAANLSSRPLERMVIGELAQAFDDWSSWVFIALLAALTGLLRWRALPVWQTLLVAGLLQATVFSSVVLPRVLAVTQEPVRHAAWLARQYAGEVVTWRLNQPSFSVYRNAVTPARLPVAGELALIRSDRLDELDRALAPLPINEVYRRGHVVLVRVGEVGQP